MFFTLYKNVGGRTHSRFFHHYKNAEIEYRKEIEECKKIGWTIKSNVDYFNVAKGWHEIYIDGKTSQGEEFAVAIIDTYFEDLE